MMNILILEDKHIRLKTFKRLFPDSQITHVETSKEAIEKLKNSSWDMLFLDHDLGGQEMVASGENTGWEVADWLSKNPDRKPSNIVLHSCNPGGRANMKAVLPEAYDIPFTALYTKSLDQDFVQ